MYDLKYLTTVRMRCLLALKTHLGPLNWEEMKVFSTDFVLQPWGSILLSGQELVCEEEEYHTSESLWSIWSRQAFTWITCEAFRSLLTCWENTKSL